jgi:hypothetical protein
MKFSPSLKNHVFSFTVTHNMSTASHSTHRSGRHKKDKRERAQEETIAAMVKEQVVSAIK